MSVTPETGGLVRRYAVDVVVFGAILLLAVARLPAPFTGDQALNMMMGQVIAEGGTPYVDLWDLKHSGVFFFFAAGGGLFGFNEIGIHLFELLWMLVLALVVRVVAGQYLRNRLVASLAPALTVGSYYLGVSSFHLTQTEALMGLPLLLSLACVVTAVQPGRRQPFWWLFASGLSAGVVFVFKGPYVALPGLFWLLALLEWRRTRGEGILPGLSTLAPPLLAGLLVPVSAALVYLAQTSGLNVIWWSFVVHPRQAASQTAVDSQRLLDGSIWFARAFALPLALAAVGGWDRLRRGWDLLTVGLAAWILTGALLIWIQVISWWSYHYLLLVVPLGLLAAQGVETSWRATTAAVGPHRSRLAAVAVAAALLGLTVLAVPQVESTAHAMTGVLRTRPLPLDAASMRAYQAEHDQAYAEALLTTSFLREPGSYAGPIYVFGSPIFYHLADRGPAIPLLVPWFHPTSELWHQFMQEFEEASPAYILRTEGALEAVTAANPSLADDVHALLASLEQRYEELRTDVGGTWYVRRDLEQTAAHP